eukprot:364546-Chlamydomonas_euryale.AAC.5
MVTARKLSLFAPCGCTGPLARAIDEAVKLLARPRGWACVCPLLQRTRHTAVARCRALATCQRAWSGTELVSHTLGALSYDHVS